MAPGTRTFSSRQEPLPLELLPSRQPIDQTAKDEADREDHHQAFDRMTFHAVHGVVHEFLGGIAGVLADTLGYLNPVVEGVRDHRGHSWYLMDLLLHLLRRFFRYVGHESAPPYAGVINRYEHCAPERLP